MNRCPGCAKLGCMRRPENCHLAILDGAERAIVRVQTIAERLEGVAREIASISPFVTKEMDAARSPSGALARARGLLADLQVQSGRAVSQLVGAAVDLDRLDRIAVTPAAAGVTP